MTLAEAVDPHDVSSRPVRRRTGGAASQYTSQYTELVQAVRETGLMRRRYAYYWTVGLLTVGALAAVWVVVGLLGNSWLQLICAGVVGFLVAQLGFLGHDAAHRQIFASATWNDWSSRILSGAFLGLSYGWWKSKHNKHHSAPNQADRDPDIAPGILVFDADDVPGRTGWQAMLLRRQGWLLFPLLTLEGLNLQVMSAITLVKGNRIPHRWTELVLITLRTGSYLTVLFLLLPPGKALAFFGVQMAVLGLSLGGAFVPNHVGMPIVGANSRVDFLRRQVMMSRNIVGGWPVRLAMGGLECQIEHHLFPSLPRPALAEVRPLVRAYCLERGITYTEVGLFAGFRSAIRHLNAVGIGQRNAFTCPLAGNLR